MSSVYSSIYPPRKITRLLWVTVALICVFFSIHFLYTFTEQEKYDNKNDLLNEQYHTFQVNSTKYRQDLTIDYKQQHSFTKDLGLFKTKGHRQEELESLLLNIPVEEIVDVTAILYMSNDKKIENVKSQLNHVLSQKVLPKKIWVLCYSCKKIKKKENVLAELFIEYQNIEFKVKPIYKLALWERFDETTQWIQQYAIDTELVWVLEPGFFPSPSYLGTMFGLLQSKEYRLSLIGNEASLLPPAATLDKNNNTVSCLSGVEQSQPVDMIHGSWLLYSQWIKLFRQHPNIDQLPLSYYISHTLLYYYDIYTVLIPSRILISVESENGALCRSTQSLLKLSLKEHPLPTILDSQHVSVKGSKGHITVLIHSQGQFSAMMPLVKRFLLQQKEILISIIISGDVSLYDLKLSLQQVNYATEKLMITPISVTSISSEYIFKLKRILDRIQPDLILQMKENTLRYHTVIEIADCQQIARIDLLENEMEHALWISDLSIQSLKAWNNVRIDLVTITDQRAQSLYRLLSSLNDAFYLGDENVEMTIHMEKTSDKETQKLVQDFNWKHGAKKIRHRIRKGGLMPAIVESWYPASDNHYGIILEDDIELSPFFYIWTKYSILKYRYENEITTSNNKYKKIYGISLYSPRNLELLPAGRVPFSPESVLEKGGYNKRMPYATPIPCSWGAVYFPEHWREFHSYLENRLDDNGFEKNMYNITVPKSRSERWKKSWKKYFIELVYLRGYIMVYPNFKAFESFSTNHLEYGTHVKEGKKNSRAQAKIDAFRVPLMQKNLILDQLPENRLPKLDELPVLNLWGQLQTSLDELDQVGSEWHSRISSCKRTASDFDPSDLFCSFSH